MSTSDVVNVRREKIVIETQNEIVRLCRLNFVITMRNNAASHCGRQYPSSSLSTHKVILFLFVLKVVEGQLFLVAQSNSSLLVRTMQLKLPCFFFFTKAFVALFWPTKPLKDPPAHFVLALFSTTSNPRISPSAQTLQPPWETTPPKPLQTARPPRRSCSTPSASSSAIPRLPKTQTMIQWSRSGSVRHAVAATSTQPPWVYSSHPRH